MQHELEKLRYPIGRFAIPDVINKSLLNDWIKTIADFPARLKSEVGVSKIFEFIIFKWYDYFSVPDVD